MSSTFLAASLTILCIVAAFVGARPPGRSVGTGAPPPRRLVGLAAPAAQVALVVALIVTALLVTPLPLAILIGWRASVPWRRARRATRRARQVALQFPDVVDLFVVAVRAGYLPALALTDVTTLAPSCTQPALAEVLARLDRGATFAESLAALRTTIGPAADPFVDALAAAERYGLPLAPVLDRLALDAREQRRRDGQASARELPVRLAAPLVVCTLPSFVLLAIVPLLLGALSSLRL